MADQGNWLAGIVECLEKSDGDRVLSEVPHRTMPARIKHCVKISCLHIRKLQSVCKSFQRLLIFLEPHLRRSLIFRHVAFWIDWRLPAFRAVRSGVDILI